MLDKNILTELDNYIAETQAKPVLEMRRNAVYDVFESIQEYDLETYINDNLEPTFNKALFDFIDKKEMNDVTVYKKALIDRKHFSKIRSNPNYKVSKNTVIALALALELTLSETDTLLQSAGFTLSNSNTSDLVIQFCIENKIYNLHDVNQAFEHLNLKPLSNFS